VLKRFRMLGDKARKFGRVYRVVWASRINYALSQLVSMRLTYGKPHEGEAGLAIARFVREAFRSVGIVRRVSKLCSSELGKAYVGAALLDIVGKVDSSKVSIVKQELAKLKGKDGLEFLESVKNIIERHFGGAARDRINKLLGHRLSNVIVSKSAVYDPVDCKLYSVNPMNGEVEVKELKIRSPNDSLELLSHGIFDKSRDIFVNYAEWRMLRIVDSGLEKGLSGKELGVYVFSKLRNELYEDEYFFESFKYYLAKHIEKLEAHKTASVAFGELLMSVGRMYRRMVAGALRAAGNLPLAGPIVESLAAGIEGFGELGEGIARSLHKNKKD